MSQGGARVARTPLHPAGGIRQPRSPGRADGLLEGRLDERRTALFEFPSMETIRAFWNSPEYGPVKELRRGVADLEIWAIPGV